MDMPEGIVTCNYLNYPYCCTDQLLASVRMSNEENIQMGDIYEICKECNDGMIQCIKRNFQFSKQVISFQMTE